MPLYNAVTKNSPVRENLAFNNRVLACKLYVATGSTATADADGWYIQPSTVVKLVGDYTVAPCDGTEGEVPFGIVDTGISIAEHAPNTPMTGMQVGVIPFLFGQAVIEVKAPTALTAGAKAKFSNTGVVALGTGDVAQCVVVKGSTTANQQIEVVF